MHYLVIHYSNTGYQKSLPTMALTKANTVDSAR